MRKRHRIRGVPGTDRRGREVDPSLGGRRAAPMVRCARPPVGRPSTPMASSRIGDPIRLRGQLLGTAAGFLSRSTEDHATQHLDERRDNCRAGRDDDERLGHAQQGHWFRGGNAKKPPGAVRPTRAPRCGVAIAIGHRSNIVDLFGRTPKRGLRGSSGLPSAAPDTGRDQ